MHREITLRMTKPAASTYRAQVIGPVPEYKIPEYDKALRARTNVVVHWLSLIHI